VHVDETADVRSLEEPRQPAARRRLDLAVALPDFRRDERETEMSVDFGLGRRREPLRPAPAREDAGRVERPAACLRPLGELRMVLARSRGIEERGRELLPGDEGEPRE